MSRVIDARRLEDLQNTYSADGTEQLVTVNLKREFNIGWSPSFWVSIEDLTFAIFCPDSDEVLS